ncbi:MAG: FUSC family protein [Clostridia bacterium]|nr:FUSC family protein [Clostridia bacterium]
MTFYQELQLNQAGSKSYVAGFKKPKDKFVHILIFIFKVLLNLAFSSAVIIVSGMIFGMENFIAGLVLLLGISVFRFTDLDIRASHSVGGIFLIFGIFAFFPKLAHLVPLGCDFLINFIAILFIVIIGCHNVKWSNHSILILSYLLLYGSDVSGFSYVKRILCLLLGATLTALVLYRNRRKTEFKYGFKNLFTDFKLSDERSRWQIKIAFCVAGAVTIASLIGAAKPAWAGIAAMSVTIPQGAMHPRVESRIRANVIGCLIMTVASIALPATLFRYFGLVGGFCAGFCGKYEGQTAWNSFSAVSAAASTLGVRTALAFRVLNNVFGALFALLFGKIIEQLLLSLNDLIVKHKQKKIASQ